jgi:salicylate hydroxylase
MLVSLLGVRCAFELQSSDPLQPYRAQGAAMAIEDAAVLGNLFTHVSHPSQITPLLRAYQDLRYPRCSATQASSRLNQFIFHLPDGPEQQKRDAAMRQAWDAEKAAGVGGEQHTTAEGTVPAIVDTDGNPNQWADKKKSLQQFGYDADKVAEEWWAEVGERTIGVLAQPAKAKL